MTRSPSPWEGKVLRDQRLLSATHLCFIVLEIVSEYIFGCDLKV